MTDTAPVPEAVTPTGGFTLKGVTISPVMAVCLAVTGICVGVWIGFKVAGGELEGAPCADCAQHRREAEILNADVPD